MISRGRVLVGLLALCALSICAFAAASASASELTAVTCKKVGAVEGEANSHCETGTAGEYKTVALPLNETTAVEGTSTGTSEGPVLRGVVDGLNITIKCSVSHLTEAWVKNTEPSPGKHKIDGGGMLTYTGCHALLKAKETRFCAIEEVTGGGKTIGMISTNTLEGETTGVEHQVKIQAAPAAAGVITKFNIKKKGEVPAEENECFFTNAVTPVEVEGTVEGEANTANHSHLTFTEANNGTLLHANGLEAKYVDTIGGNMLGEPETTVGATTFT